MMKKYFILIVAVMTLSTALLAQGHHLVNPNVPVGPKIDSNPNLKARPGVDMSDMMDKVMLTDTQKAKMVEIMLSHRKQMNTLQAEIENLRIDLMQSLKKEDFANARKIVAQISEKKLNRKLARLDLMETMSRELTSEQKEFFHDHMFQMGQGKMMQSPRMGMYQDSMEGCGMMMGKGMGMMHGNQGMREKGCGMMGEGMGMMHGNQGMREKGCGLMGQGRNEGCNEHMGQGYGKMQGGMGLHRNSDPNKPCLGECDDCRLKEQPKAMDSKKTETPK